jgi:sulfite reductase beta subunit-like hemoprotein
VHPPRKQHDLDRRRQGRGELRLTVWQNLILPGIPEEKIQAAITAIQAAGLDHRNNAIAGGLISLIAFGGGNWSVDGWISRRQAEVEAGAPAPKPRVTAKSPPQA